LTIVYNTGNPRVASAQQNGLDPSATACCIIDINPGVHYYFRITTVELYNAEIDAWSTVIEHTTPPATSIAPEAPSSGIGVAQVPGTPTVAFTWPSRSTNNGASYYTVQYKATDDPEWTTVDVAMTDTSIKWNGGTVMHTWITPDLEGGKTYDFQVQAVNAAGRSNWSAVQTIEVEWDS